MLKTWRERAGSLLVSGLLGMLAASPAMAAADEGWAEIRWNWRWASGSIVYNRDAEPTDFQDGGATFRNSIGPYAMESWREFVPTYFQGWGGTMVTRNLEVPNCDPTDQCSSMSIDIHFGRLIPGDPAEWTLRLTAPGSLDARGLPPLGGATNLDGWLSNNLDDRTYGALDSNFGNWHETVAAPVPEPLPLLLMGAGVFAVAVRAGRRPRPGAVNRPS
jgi:hypothetical protein